MLDGWSIAARYLASGDAVAGLSALVAQDGLDSFATAAYGRIDPRTGSGSWATAGHLPFLLLPVDGLPRYLDVTGSPPLGLSDAATDHLIVVRRGDTLLLYTEAHRTPERAHRSGPGTPPVGGADAG